MTHAAPPPPPSPLSPPGRHAPPGPPAAPLALDLDEFQRMKRILTLPDGLELAYLDLGPRDGPPLALIHGYTDSARDWVPLLPHLAQHRRLILVDLRGHGSSSTPADGYRRGDFARDLKCVLDRLGIARADIMGHSLGSIVAQTFAEYWPERTRRVVLISSTGGLPPGTPPAAFDYAAEIRALAEPIAADSPFMLAWWDSPAPVDPEFLRRQREDAARIPLRVWLAVLEQSLPPDHGYADLQRTLPLLIAPTLLIWGSSDSLMEEPARDSLRKALPTARVRVFDGLGHNPFWEDPAAVAQEIDAFLDDRALEE